MELTALAYVSTAVRRLGDEELEALLFDARNCNQREQVTGALLHHDGSFFQYIEGPSEGVTRVYARIQRSSKHKGLIKLIQGRIDQRYFSEWHMAFAEAAGTLLQQLANSRWITALPSLQDGAAKSSGLALLLGFWSRTRRGDASNAP
ncbi:MAG: BLUF domain-containing protein [Rubrivivax sp.]